MRESQPVAQQMDLENASYWEQSRRPLSSLVFMAPLLLFYEIGVFLFDVDELRNGADVWLRLLLRQMGFGQYFLLPLLTIAGLLALHHLTRQPWTISRRVVLAMYLESALLAFFLLMIAYPLRSLIHELTSLTVDIRSWAGLDVLKPVVRYMGAGVYEETLFRLIMIPIVSGIIGIAGGSARSRTIGAVIMTSLLFSLAHYLPGGDSFQIFSFVFRFVAGVFFAVLYLYRGFGIAAGAHALYDIFVGINLP